jgi:hypothetical protein
MRDELTTQLSLPPARFVVVNTAGVVELEKRRPVDSLALILEERSTTKLEHFFRSYGPAEVAAMCFMLATQLRAEKPQVQTFLQQAQGNCVCMAAARRGAIMMYECFDVLKKKTR